MTRVPLVFISYQSTDANVALQVREHLAGLGVRTFMDQFDIPVGAYWPDAIDDALTESDIVLGIASPDAVASRNVKNEWDWAIQNDRRLLLLQIASTVLPHRYVSINFIDATGPDPSEGLRRLSLALGFSDAPKSAARIEEIFNVPTPITPLVGRQQELAQLSDMLRSSRLITLIGTGGTGKTRLALALAQLVRERFPDGVRFVSLAPVRDPRLVMATLASALGIAETGHRSLIQDLSAALRQKKLLLLLDNCEHVIAAMPDVVDLLTQCADLYVVATSRAPLHLSGEQEFTVLPLPTHEPSDTRSVDPLGHSEAVELFVQRARGVKPDFHLTRDNIRAVTLICQQLGGLPLAIELAASRCKVLTPDAILSHLDQPLEFLTGGARDLPERQQTLRNTIQWSYDLLEPEEKVLYRRLSVFLGGWTLEAVEAVANADGSLATTVLDRLSSLVDKSLVIQQEQPSGESRFTMLETIREFASERLAESDEADQLRRRHAEYFVDFIERPIERWFKNQLDAAEQMLWLDRVELEHGNFSAAFAWAVAHDSTGIGLRLVAAHWPVWFVQARFSEGYRWATQVTEPPIAMPNPTYATALFTVGFFLERTGQYQEATNMLEQSASVARAIGAVVPLALSLNFLGNLARSHDNDNSHARDLYRQARELFQAANFSTGIALATANLGLIARLEGEYESARHYSEEALAMSERGVPWVVTLALTNLADLALITGDRERARLLGRRSLQLSLQMGQRLAVRDRVLLQPEDIDQVEQLTMLSSSNNLSIAGDLFLFARIEAEEGNHVVAAQIVGTVARMLASAGLGFDALHWRSTEPTALIESLRQHLGEQSFAEAMDAGRETSSEQMIALMLRP